MKKKLTYLLLAACAILSFLLFVNFGMKENESSSDGMSIRNTQWTLQKVDDFKVMTVAPNGDWMTDIKKAMLSKRLEDGNLPVSFALTIAGSDAPDSIVGMDCRLQYKEIKMEGPIKNLKTVRDDSTFVSKGLFSFNFSKAENATIDNLYHLSALSADHLKMCVKPHYAKTDETEWHELVCKY